MKTILISAVLVLAIAPGATNPKASPNSFDTTYPPTANSEIDRLVFQKLATLGLQPLLCSEP